MCCIGTFGEYTVCSEASCIKIEPDIPLDKAALVGCGVTTGWGSAVYAAEVQPGRDRRRGRLRRRRHERRAGRGAVRRRATSIAVDPVEFKREQAQIFGATHTRRLHRGGTALVDRADVGRAGRQGDRHHGRRRRQAARSVMGLCAKGGRVVWTNVAKINDTDVPLNLFNLTLQEKQLVGSIFGSANPRRDIPRLLRLYQEGKLKLDELITKHLPARRHQRGLPGHARRQEHPRHGDVRPRLTGSVKVAFAPDRRGARGGR